MSMLNDQEVSRLLDVANAGVNRGEVARARRVYAGILADRPGHVPTLISLAMSHIAVGEYNDADAILRDKVLADNPDDAGALAYLGLSAALADRKDEAREILERIPAGTTAGEMAARIIETL